MTVPTEVSTPPASIVGIGAVTPLGRDIEGIARKLEKQCETRGIMRVDDALLVDAAISRHMRRADRFGRMAAMAAVDAWNSAKAGCAGVPLERVGIIVSSGFGPHCRGFRFLDGILECGDAAASPTDFSHSVHGAASAYISGLLGLRGPSLNATDFQIGFEEIVALAQCWLAEGACDRILVGAVEELGEFMLHYAARMLGGLAGFAPGEGSVFLVLAPADTPGIALVDATAASHRTDLLIVEEPAIITNNEPAQTIEAQRTITFSPYFGHSASSTAMQLLGGILAMRAGRTLGRTIASSGGRSAVDNATTLRTSSGSRAATLLLTRNKL